VFFFFFFKVNAFFFNINNSEITSMYDCIFIAREYSRKWQISKTLISNKCFCVFMCCKDHLKLWQRIV